MPGLREASRALRNHGKRGIEVTRYKGLGEMNAEQLWDKTMDPARRTMIQVRLEDLAATDRIFTILMGTDVEPRCQFIEDKALNAKKRDI